MVKVFLDVKGTIFNPVWVWFMLQIVLSNTGCKFGLILPLLLISVWSLWKGEKELDKNSGSQRRAKLNGPHRDWKPWPLTLELMTTSLFFFFFLPTILKKISLSWEIPVIWVTNACSGRQKKIPWVQKSLDTLCPSLKFTIYINRESILRKAVLKNPG